jgi:hypothetical protein
MKKRVLAAALVAPTMLLGPATYTVDLKAQFVGKSGTRTNTEGQRHTETYHGNGATFCGSS